MQLSSAPWRVVHWDGATLGNWTSELENADVLINLACRSVDCLTQNLTSAAPTSPFVPYLLESGGRAQR